MPVYTTNIDRDRREIDVSKRIAYLEPDATPFTAILMRAKKVPATSAEIVWYEDQLGARWTKVNYSSGYAHNATAIVVDDLDIFKKYDIVKVPRTGETMLITDFDTTDGEIIVTRDFGGTKPSGGGATAYNLEDEDWLMVLGNAMEEGSRVPDERIGQPTKVNNYCQIFRTPFSVTGTTQAERTRTSEQERARLTRKKGMEHKIDIERALLFGEKKESTSGGVRRTLGGMTQFIQSNVFDASADQGDGSLDEDTFEAFCEMVFKYGSSQKLLVASSKLISVINAFGRDKIQTVSKEESYGLRMSRYISAHGDLLIVNSKVLVNYYSGWGIVADMDKIEYKPLRDTQLNRGIQPADEDAIRDEYLTEVTLKVENEECHGIIKGVTGISRDNIVPVVNVTIDGDALADLIGGNGSDGGNGGEG